MTTPAECSTHHPDCPARGATCLCESLRQKDLLLKFASFVNRSHTGHDVMRGCTSGICNEIEKLEKAGIRIPRR